STRYSISRDSNSCLTTFSVGFAVPVLVVTRLLWRERVPLYPFLQDRARLLPAVSVETTRHCAEDTDWDSYVELWEAQLWPFSTVGDGSGPLRSPSNLYELDMQFEEHR